MLIARIQLMKLGRSLPIRGVSTICTEMCGNGAGTGLGTIRVRHRLTQPARPPGLPALPATAVGTVLPRVSAPHAGTATIHPAGLLIWGSALYAPEEIRNEE